MLMGENEITFVRVSRNALGKSACCVTECTICSLVNYTSFGVLCPAALFFFSQVILLFTFLFLLGILSLLMK